MQHGSPSLTSSQPKLSVPGWLVFLVVYELHLRPYPIIAELQIEQAAATERYVHPRKRGRACSRQWQGRRVMPLYRCRYWDSAGNMVRTLLAVEDDGEAIEMARSMSANSDGERWFELFEGERFVRIGKQPTPAVKARHLR